MRTSSENCAAVAWTDMRITGVGVDRISDGGGIVCGDGNIFYAVSRCECVRLLAAGLFLSETNEGKKN